MGPRATEPVATLSPNDPCPVKPFMDDVTLEEALSEAGKGKFQTVLALVGSLCFLAGGLQNSLNAYIIPSIKCDIGITSSQMGLLNAGFLAGALTSGFLTGILVDNVGRKPILVYFMFFDGICTLLAAIAPSYSLLLVLRTLSGFLVGGPSAIILTYVGEFYPVKSRNQIICFVGVSWTMSWVLLPLSAMGVIPLDFEFYLGTVRFNSWRLLVVIYSFPSLISSILLTTLPESPKFLVINGQTEKAVRVLSKVYSINTGLPRCDYPVKSLERVKETLKMENKSICKPFIMMMNQIKIMIFGPAFRILILMNFIFFTNMFGYYGLGLWLPELFNRFQDFESQNPNATISVCQASKITIDIDECDSSSISWMVFGYSFIMGIASLIGNLASGVLIPKLPRPVMPVVFMLGSSLSVFLLYYVINSVQNLIVSVIFQLCIGSSNIVYNALIVDMFPNEISGLAVCLTIAFGRLGAVVSNLVFGLFLDINCAIPLFTCVILIALGGLFSFSMPKGPYEQGNVKKVATIA